MVSDTVVAIVPEHVLPDILTQVHRDGYGHNARVLRPRRSPLREQLRRAGVPVEQAPARLDDAECLLMVMAAARSPKAADLMLQHGASATWIVARTGDWSLIDDRVIIQPATVDPEPVATPPLIPASESLPPDAQGPI